MGIVSISTKGTPAVSLAFLLLSGLALHQITSNAPAFQDKFHITGITGNTRLSHSAAMYDRAAYLFQLGYGYQNADVLSFVGVIPANDAISPNDTKQRLEKAAELLEESLRLDPSNAHAWQVYAQTLFAVGTIEQTENALQRSWELGASNKRLAIARHFLIDGMRKFTGVSDAYADIYDSDIKVLELNAPRALRLKL